MFKSLKIKLKKWLSLAFTFLKIGALTFGGGYAMICVIEREAVTKKKWLSSEEMLDIVAIAESTPGPIALNAATFVGAKVAGFSGALIASISVLLPAVIIITLISALINQFFDNKYLNYAFLGMRAGVAALILNAVFKLGKFLKTERRPAVYAILIISLILGLLSAFKILPFDNIFIILGAIVFGIIYTILEGLIKKKKNIVSMSDANTLIEIPPCNTSLSKKSTFEEKKSLDENINPLNSAESNESSSSENIYPLNSAESKESSSSENINPLNSAESNESSSSENIKGGVEK